MSKTLTAKVGPKRKGRNGRRNPKRWKARGGWLRYWTGQAWKRIQTLPVDIGPSVRVKLGAVTIELSLDVPELAGAGPGSAGVTDAS